MSQCHLNDCCFLEERDWFIFLNAYWCNLSICMLFQNAEWVQIAVMKLFHYGDEQCWINRNNVAECFIEPSVKVFWHQVLLCLQLWWLAQGWRWLQEKWNSSNPKLERSTQKQANNRFHLIFYLTESSPYPTSFTELYIGLEKNFYSEVREVYKYESTKFLSKYNYKK